MIVFLRSVGVFVGVLALAGGVGYASLVYWDRSHPPRLPGFERPAAKAPATMRAVARDAMR